MSRYVGPKLRVTRRLGKLRGFSRKKPFRRSFSGKGGLKGKVLSPGQHGLSKVFKSKSFGTQSDYLIRLKVKNRLRFNYGITEKQLVNCMKNAKKNKTQNTGLILLQLLEMRLDNVVFRLNMAPTIPAARQLVNHGHIRVNQKKVDIASYVCKPKEVISVATKESSLRLVNNNLNQYYKRMNFYKQRLSRTLGYILLKAELVKNMADGLQMIQDGKISVNNRKVVQPNFILQPKDVISLVSDKGSRKVKVSDYVKNTSLKRV